jgi:hypothetical protein
VGKGGARRNPYQTCGTGGICAGGGPLPRKGLIPEVLQFSPEVSLCG